MYEKSVPLFKSRVPDTEKKTWTCSVCEACNARDQTESVTYYLLNVQKYIFKLSSNPADVSAASTGAMSLPLHPRDHHRRLSEQISEDDV